MSGIKYVKLEKKKLHTSKYTNTYTKTDLVIKLVGLWMFGEHPIARWDTYSKPEKKHMIQFYKYIHMLRS